MTAPTPRRPAGRALAGALALCMSFAPGPARAAPSARDLAYEQGVLAGALASMSFAPGPDRAAPSARDLAYEQGVLAEEAGDHAAAAARFAEAYRLTPPTETGPRLLFLRASVAARLRAHEAAPGSAEHLCAARTLLRDYLGETAPTGERDPLAEERESLARVDRQLAGADCSPAPPAPQEPVPGDISSPGPPPAPQNVPKDSSIADPGAAPRDSSIPDPGTAAPATAPRTNPRRPLVIAGATGLAAGAAALVVMGVGIDIARDATGDGRDRCWSRPSGCNSGSDGVPELLDRGRLGDQLIKAGAAIGGLATLAGVVLLALAARTRPRARVGLAPRLAPGTAAIGLWGRF